MTPDWTALVVATGLKSALCLALAWLVSLLLTRRSAAERHLVWVLAITGVLVLPVLQLAVPGWPLPLGISAPWLETPPARPAADAASLTSRETTPTAAVSGPLDAASAGAARQRERLTRPDAGTRSRDVRSVLAVAWPVGAAFALAPLALAFVRIARIARRAQPLDAPRWSVLARRAALSQRLPRRRLDLRRAAGPTTPLTWGIVRPVVILPESCDAWSDAQAYEVLVHEAGHVRRHDCLTQLLASACCVLYWWNPLVWLAARQMLTERERACDDRVLLAGARASDYANDLLELARSFGAPWSTSHVTTAMARRSQIAGRLLAVLDPQLDRRAVGARSVLSGGALLLLILLPLAAATPVATSGAPEDTATEPVTVTIPMSVAAPTSPDGDAPPLDFAEASREIAARERVLAQILARGDLAAAAQFYTEDVQVAAPSLPIAYGRQGARGLLQHLADAGVTGIELDEPELYPVGALACETGRERLTAGAGAPVVSHRVIRLWKNEDGSWRIHREWATR